MKRPSRASLISGAVGWRLITVCVEPPVAALSALTTATRAIGSVQGFGA